MQREMALSPSPILVLPLTRGNALWPSRMTNIWSRALRYRRRPRYRSDIDQISAGLTEALEELRDWIAATRPPWKGFRDG